MHIFPTDKIKQTHKVHCTRLDRHER